MILGDERVGFENETAGDARPEQAAAPAAPTAPPRPPPVLDELALFAVSSSVTELLMGIQDVNTLLFEIQELRHATSVAPPADSQSNGASPANDVDAALMRLDAKMDEVRKDFGAVETQVQPLLASFAPDERGEVKLLRQKWADAVDEWETVQKDADVLGDELKEDKWLAVFRTVSSQAHDMMRSLDKVLVQSQHFVSDVHGHARPSSTSGHPRSPLRRSPSAFASLSLGPPPGETPTRGGPLKVSASSPTIATLGTVSSPDNPLRASTSSRPTPPRPPKSLKRLVSDSQASPPAALTPPRAPFTLSHRRSASAMTSSYSGLGSSLSSVNGARQSMLGTRRPVSPTPGAVLESRPRWNSSVKPLDEREVLNSSTKLPRSGRLSAAGLHRPSSRASNMSRSHGPGAGSAARPVSPAFSDASSVAYRDRPETPSKIPRPSSVMRRQSGALGFDDPDAASLFARAVSPTPSTGTSASRPPLSASGRYSLSRSMGPPSTTPSRPTSPALSASSSSYYRSTQTPEPSLMAQAQRLAGVRAPPSAVGGASRLSRPGSSLGSSRLDRSTTPLPSGEPGAYVPNPRDPLDTSVAALVNSLPLLLRVTRVDPPLSPHATVEVYSARYTFGLPSRPLDDQRKAVMCKLVDRVGPRAKKGEKKVLVRVGGGWQDLETYTLGLMASSV
ncbi:hypothetical protein DMC30DRAFT_345792 [Rhodotorula diobovata]|uniref:GAR domain-containing protein n=1 Tax=Rhodotorula diobovata TaxID=5288 RepID=A0A5C5G5J5_9BASI|nr:hypothetical protein DMC30DRAFT_345792 [Rhodotorula diobovata]